MKPELLAPAGDFEKLKTAIAYGADAVYFGGSGFSLRARGKNFDAPGMKEAVAYARRKGVKSYAAVNIYARNHDLNLLENYFKYIEEIGADAVIISDPGVFSIAKNVLNNVKIHISTQANVTNYQAVNFWRGAGASRIVLARELSLREINEIKQKTNAELEVFVHGAMCVSYSGRCLLSSFTTGRDGNAGDCAQACRWKYFLTEEKRPGEFFPIEEDSRGAYILNSKDLCMIKHIPDLDGLAALKIEGRMKSAYYAGTVVKAYREALDDYYADPELYFSKLDHYFTEVSKNSHRKFTTGFYYGEGEQNYDSASYIRDWDFVGAVLDCSNGFAKIEQRNKIKKGDIAEFVLQKGENFSIEITEIFDENFEPIEEAPRAQQIIYIKIPQGKNTNKYDMLRRAQKLP